MIQLNEHSVKPEYCVLYRFQKPIHKNQTALVNFKNALFFLYTNLKFHVLAWNFNTAFYF